MSYSIFTPELLTELFRPIISSSNLWENKQLSVFVIANPNAGGFTRKVVAEKNLKTLQSFATFGLSQKTKIVSLKVKKTEFAGQGSNYTIDILQQVKSSRKDDAFLIITAGGDGTHLEVQTALIKAALSSLEDEELIHNKITLLRLPFGTGNDGSDGRTLEETLKLLIEPAHFSLQKAIKVWYEGKNTPKNSNQEIDQYDSLDVSPPWYSFNIASIGIDAFITYMTNKTKGIIPGDFYQLWVDLACVFYNQKFPQKQLHVEVYSDDQLLKVVDSPVEFVLLGVSGHRTYGSNHKILPTDDSFCLVKKMPLLTKLLTKNSFNIGTHVNSKYSEFANATEIRISYDQNILVQMDGEVHILQPENFPLIMKQTKPIIKIIEKDSSTISKGTVRI